VQPVSAETITLADGRSVVLQERIGRGTCGVVYRAFVESGWGVKRPVAVKLFEIPQEHDHGELMRRLGRIARRASSIRHSSVVQIYELDRIDSAPGHHPQPFFVTELVEGESLASIVNGWYSHGHRVPIDFAVVVVLRAAEALGAALFTDTVDGTIANLVHGDLSPRQVLISNAGEVKVSDFSQGALREVTSTIRSRTRLAYTAPEVASGADPDPRSDVFALGVMLHELLLGSRFGPGTDFADAIQMVRDGRFRLNVLEPNIPRDLRDVLYAATERNATLRYPHARAMASDLRREMHRLGLCDTETSVRHAVVGWCAPIADDTIIETAPPIPVPRQSEVVPKNRDEDTAAETRTAKLKL